MQVSRAVGVILLLRGTGLASAGLIAAATLFAESDPMRWATLVPLGAGTVLALVSVPTMQSLPGMKARRFAVAAAAPILLLWIALNLWQAWKIRHMLHWLAPLPANFLPDVYALWTLGRGRGRLFLARAMVVLAAISSLAVAWLGSALFLA